MAIRLEPSLRFQSGRENTVYVQYDPVEGYSRDMRPEILNQLNTLGNTCFLLVPDETGFDYLLSAKDMPCGMYVYGFTTNVSFYSCRLGGFDKNGAFFIEYLTGRAIYANTTQYVKAGSSWEDIIYDDGPTYPNQWRGLLVVCTGTPYFAEVV